MSTEQFNDSRYVYLRTAAEKQAALPIRPSDEVLVGTVNKTWEPTENVSIGKLDTNLPYRRVRPEFANSEGKLAERFKDDSYDYIATAEQREAAGDVSRIGDQYWSKWYGPDNGPGWTDVPVVGMSLHPKDIYRRPKAVASQLGGKNQELRDTAICAPGRECVQEPRQYGKAHASVQELVLAITRLRGELDAEKAKRQKAEEHYSQAVKETLDVSVRCSSLNQEVAELRAGKQKNIERGNAIIEKIQKVVCGCTLNKCITDSVEGWVDSLIELFQSRAPTTIGLNGVVFWYDQNAYNEQVRRAEEAEKAAGTLRLNEVRHRAVENELEAIKSHFGLSHALIYHEYTLVQGVPTYRELQDKLDEILRRIQGLNSYFSGYASPLAAVSALCEYWKNQHDSIRDGIEEIKKTGVHALRGTFAKDVKALVCKLQHAEKNEAAAIDARTKLEVRLNKFYDITVGPFGRDLESIGREYKLYIVDGHLKYNHPASQHVDRVKSLLGLTFEPNAGYFAIEEAIQRLKDSRDEYRRMACFL